MIVSLLDLLERVAEAVPNLIVFAFIVQIALKHQKEVFSRVESALKEHNKRLIITERALAKLCQVILYHDATVKGINPDVLGSPEEIMKNIITESEKNGKEEDSNPG